jgi:hypothetical protein
MRAGAGCRGSFAPEVVSLIQMVCVCCVRLLGHVCARALAASCMYA